jgi:hypothetical protein
MPACQGALCVSRRNASLRPSVFRTLTRASRLLQKERQNRAACPLPQQRAIRLMLTLRHTIARRSSNQPATSPQSKAGGMCRKSMASLINGTRKIIFRGMGAIRGRYGGRI